MEILERNEIEGGLIGSHRTYLCGNLQNPTKARHIHTDDYEIGISQYSEYTVEMPHYHSFNIEYNYVISGQVKVLLLNEGIEKVLKSGDLFVIQTEEPYLCKAMPNTKVIFSKVPGGNDKVTLQLNENIRRWGESWEKEYEE